MNLYEINDLRVFFGTKQALAADRLRIRAGVITAITGPSGVGKTTLLRSLNRLNEFFSDCITTGTVNILTDNEMQSVDSIPAETLRRRAGMVFQNPNVLPLSIEKNFTVPLVHGAGIKKHEAGEIMEEMLHTVGLWNEVKDRLASPAVALSGGQQQRLCLARALALKPSILLLDEPTSSLDDEAGAVVELCIKNLLPAVSIILVTHDLKQAERLGEDFIKF
jgi:phosphate transport system ATP-binding protein